jgi:hypothetical protein
MTKNSAWPWHRNLDRSIIIMKGGQNWVYVLLYARNAMANIGRDDLIGFRELADIDGSKSDADSARDLADRVIVEICDV